MNKCKVCGKYIQTFSPSKNYCSKDCENNDGKDGQVDNLMRMFGFIK